MSPTVSVVLPTYNHAHFLPAAITSVIQQTFSDWELLVVDNSSTDSTSDVLEGFADPRIHVFKIQNCGIIARSRNLGIQNAKGVYVAFLDSDDRWYPTKLEVCLSRLRDNTDIVCHGECWVGGSQPVRNVMYGPARKASARSLILRGNCLSTSAVVVSRDKLLAVSGFSEQPQFVTAEDYELWIRLAQHNSVAVFIDRVLGEFTRSTSSASADIERNVAAEIAVCDHHMRATYTGVSLWFRHRQRMARAYYGAGRAFSARHQQRRALTWYRRALLSSPFVVRLWPAMVISAISRRRVSV